MATIVGLSILAVVAATLFGYFLCRLLCMDDDADITSRQRKDLTESNILKWVARQSVADLANRADNASRITVADVNANENRAAPNAYVCNVNTKSWDSIVFKVHVTRVSSVRFTSSVHCSENGRTLFYTRKYELEITGLDETIESA